MRRKKKTYSKVTSRDIQQALGVLTPQSPEEQVLFDAMNPYFETDDDLERELIDSIKNSQRLLWHDVENNGKNSFFRG